MEFTELLRRERSRGTGEEYEGAASSTVAAMFCPPMDTWLLSRRRLRRRRMPRMRSLAGVTEGLKDREPLRRNQRPRRRVVKAKTRCCCMTLSGSWCRIHGHPTWLLRHHQDTSRTLWLSPLEHASPRSRLVPCHQGGTFERSYRFCHKPYKEAPSRRRAGRGLRFVVNPFWDKSQLNRHLRPQCLGRPGSIAVRQHFSTHALSIHKRLSH